MATPPPQPDNKKYAIEIGTTADSLIHTCVLYKFKRQERNFLLHGIIWAEPTTIDYVISWILQLPAVQIKD